MCSLGMYEHYEPRYWGLDPVFCARVKLSVHDVLSLHSHPDIPDILCFLNHPIQSVHIMGDVVSVKQKSRLVEYKVDDGTGVISCTQWRVTEDSDEGLTLPILGGLVSVWGKLSEFRSERQLTVTNMVQHKDPNVEPLHWLEVAQLKQTVYSRPFILPHGVLSDGETSSGARKFSRDALKSCIISHLKSHHSSGHITLADLVREEGLLEACRNESELADWSDEELVREVNLLAQDLPSEGIVVLARGQGVLREGATFELLHLRKHLCPFILEYIRRKERQSESAVRLGIPENWIVEHIKQKAIFQLLPASLVVEGIELLLGDSVIYDHGNKNYRTVS